MSYTVEVNLNIDFRQEEIEGLLDTAGYSIGYWAISARIENGRYVVLPAEQPGESESASFQEIATALTRVAFDQHLSVREDLREHARRGILEDDPSEWDGEIADVTVQVALYGEIVYG